MAEQFEIPEEFETPFRRIIPYLSAPLQNEPKVLQALVLYFKLGGEKMARIVIDALNVTHKLQYKEMIKKIREEAMLRDRREDEDSGNDDEGEGDAQENKGDDFDA